MKKTTCQSWKILIVFIFVLLGANLKAFAQTYEGNIVAEEGAWCWFADSRALHYENAGNTINSTYIGYIDVHGNIKATQRDFLTNKTNEVLIRSYFQPDDHDNPTFLVLPDERIMIFYSRHTDESCFYYRISQKPGDITTLGAEKKIITAQGTTYPSPFILSDDPTHIYLCWRGINWHPTIAKLSIPDANDNVSFTWGPYQIVQSTASRPYAKYATNGVDKIYMTYTTGHPDNEYPNWVYFNYIDINTLKLKDITGTILSTISSGPHSVNRTTYSSTYPNAVVDAPTNQRDWVWQTTLDTDGNPVVAMVQINDTKTIHNYYYAKWTGTTWRKTFLANGGGKFHQTPGLELCYSGGMTIDDANPNIVYCSVPVAGTYGTIYEIKKYTIATNGTVSATEQITTNSHLNNVRPYIITNSGTSALRLTWMHGNYYDWIVSSSYPLGFPTAIHSDYDLMTDIVDLTNGLVVNETFDGLVTGTAYTTDGVLVSTTSTYATISAASSPAFSISLTPYIYEESYSDTILKMGNITYVLDETTLKPHVIIGDTTYNSTNLLGNSDVWKTTARGTGGVWYTPTKLKYFNLTLTYENSTLTIYRNGLIDQVIDVAGLTLSDINLGGFFGWIEDCRVYNRALLQGEVKQLTNTSLAYTFDNALVNEILLETIEIPENVYTDILLPTSVSGSTVTWASTNTSIIPTTGLVNLPATETQVTLTATANSISKNFIVTVFPRNIENNVLIAYSFDPGDEYTENSVRYVRDKSGNNNDAIIHGSAVVDGTLDLTANTAAGFATNGYATAPNGMLGNVRSFTFLAKIHPASLSSQPRLFDFGSAATNSYFLRGNGYTAGYKYNGASTILINSSTALAVGSESKVAMTFDAKTKTTKIYLNSTQTASATTITREPYELTLIAADNREYIGRAQWWDSGVAADNIDFDGTMDDIYFYDIALTAAEIDAVQNPVLAVMQIKENKLLTFPNPASKNTSINISYDNFNSENLKLEVINSLGQVVKVKDLTNSVITLDGLSQEGIYLLRLSNGVTGKLIIK